MKEREEITLETVYNSIWLERKYTTNKIQEKANSVEYLSDNYHVKKKKKKTKCAEQKKWSLKCCIKMASKKTNKILLDIGTI